MTSKDFSEYVKIGHREYEEEDTQLLYEQMVAYLDEVTTRDADELSDDAISALDEARGMLLELILRNEGDGE